MRPEGATVFVGAHEKFGVTPSLELEQAANKQFGEKTYYARVDTSLPEKAAPQLGKEKRRQQRRMKSRREFFKSAAALGVLGATGLPLRAHGNAANRFNFW